ncbi:MAG TPA: response regulator, partial [Lysobacter sp.]
PQAEAPATPAPASPVPPGAAGDGALDVAVVDDNVDAAQTLQILLEAYGHRVRVYHRAGDALDALLERPSDVAFLDIGLPDMTGHALAQRLRARLGARSGVLAALSGYGQPQDFDASREAGLDCHLVKPIDPATLLDVLARARVPDAVR